MKKVIIATSILGVALLFFLFFRGKSKEAEAKFITAEVQRGDISIIVTATGSLEAVTTVQVGSQISGTISALSADFNDWVKKGQVLAQLDPTFLKAQVAQAQADLEKAIASAELSQKEYERSLTLFQQDMISESDRDASLTNYELAKAEQKSAQANLERVKTNLDYATIVSPIDGVVISRNVDVGQTVAASLQAPTLFTIAQDLTKMQVQASIDEADVGKIKDGQRVVFTVDAYPEQSFQGKVKQIRLAPEVVQNVVTYDVIIEVSNPNLQLMPGMTANVTILVDQRQDVLKVPAGALRFHPSLGTKGSASNGKSNVRLTANLASAGDANPNRSDSSDLKKSKQTMLWILKQQGKPESVSVQVGISDGTFTQIISDHFKEGDKVIIGQEGAVSSTNNQQVNPFTPRFGGGRR